MPTHYLRLLEIEHKPFGIIYGFVGTSVDVKEKVSALLLYTTVHSLCSTASDIPSVLQPLQLTRKKAIDEGSFN